jgi:hypothetical protein
VWSDGAGLRVPVGPRLDAQLAALELGVLDEGGLDRAQQRVSLGFCVTQDLLAELLGEGDAVLLGLGEIFTGRRILYRFGARFWPSAMVLDSRSIWRRTAVAISTGPRLPPRPEKAPRTAFSMPRSRLSSSPTGTSFC